MKRLALLSLALVFTACGGGGGNDSGGGATCGDSVVSGSEQCDDGNTVSGDGCDATCRIERTGTCGDGTVDVQFEQCDDGNTVGGDGCSAQCDNEGVPSRCGDGTVDANEQCDDHNMVSGDGCSSTCTIEGPGDGTCASPETVDLEDDGDGYYFGEIMGDTTGAANGYAAAACGSTAGIGAGGDRTYKIVLTGNSNLTIESFDDAAFAGAMRLTTTACMDSTEVPLHGTVAGCTMDFYNGLEFDNLPAGTYYLTVDGAGATDAGEYDFFVDIEPSYCADGFLDSFSHEVCDDNNQTNGDGCSSRCEVEPGFDCTADDPSVCTANDCGNNVLDAGEQCDDGANASGDGCDPYCHEEPGYDCTGSPSTCTLENAGCGDGIIQSGEECDDDAVANGDGCSSTCTLESDVTEVEPNDTTPQVLTAGSHRIKGSFLADDVDQYTFTLAAAAHVEVEVYTTIDASRPYTGIGDDRYDCVGPDSDPYLYIYTAAADPDVDDSLFSDDDHGAINDGGDYGCSYIGDHDPDDDMQGDLAAGSYKLYIYNHSGDPLARYLIDLRITP